MLETMSPLELANLIHNLETYGEGASYQESEQWLDSLTGATTKPVYTPAIRNFLWCVCYWVANPNSNGVATLKRSIDTLLVPDGETPGLTTLGMRQQWVTEYATNAISTLFGTVKATDYTTLLNTIGVTL